MKIEDSMNCKEVLKTIAVQLNEWAIESREGGWSTHQVEPMKKLSKDIYSYIGKNLM